MQSKNISALFYKKNSGIYSPFSLLMRNTNKWQKYKATIESMLLECSRTTVL